MEHNYVPPLLSFLMVAALWAFYRYGTILLLEKRNKESVRQRMKKEMELLETDRRRIANDLHDDIGTLLSSISIRINCLQAQTDRDLENLGLVRKYLSEVMQRIGDISRNLNPLILSSKGLDAALEEFFNNCRGLSSADFDYVFKVKNFISPLQRLHLYRMIQEMTHNALKYSRASRIQVCLYDEKNVMHLVYSDNGVGLPHNVGGSSKGLGMESLKRRTEILDGTMETKSEPGKGVEHYFEFPLRHEYAY